MSDLPVFFTDQVIPASQAVTLPEDTARHVIQVLRMKQGDRLQLTDGKGNLYTAEITSDHKKDARVNILSAIYSDPAAPAVTIAISLVKNASRFEWFLEKATEIGVREIIPLVCTRTEKQHFRADRMKNILTSAMLQSKQAWLPRLHDPLAFPACVAQGAARKKYIAHCLETDRRSITEASGGREEAMVLIGPEGDFTQAEIELATGHGFIPVTLGYTRLRTETAGIVAATILTVR